MTQRGKGTGRKTNRVVRTPATKLPHVAKTRLTKKPPPGGPRKPTR
jgi:hypothetical protein